MTDLETMPDEPKREMREFDTGATRDSDHDKLDFEGFLSPLAVEAYAKYLNAHRVQANGHLRDSDNWQKGIPFAVYMKSLWRHFHAMWKLHRMMVWGRPVAEADLDEAIGGVLFNAFGYWHELKMMHLRGGQQASSAPDVT